MNTYGDAIFSPIYVTFEIAENYNNRFISNYLTSKPFIKNARRFEQGTVYERISVTPEHLLQLYINIPNIQIQGKISFIFDSYNSKIYNEYRLLNNYIKFKKYLLKSLFI